MKQVPDHVPPHLVRPFDQISDPQMFEDPFAYFASLHEGPEIFWSTGLGGFWVVTRAEAIRELTQNPADFSNYPAGIGTSRFPLKLVPLEADPPEHAQYRNMIARLMAPAAIQARTAQISSVINGLIDKVVDQGECEFNQAIADPFPTAIFTALMGLPLSESDKFLDWNKRVLHSVDVPNAQTAGMEIAGYLTKLIAQRRVEPQDDLVSALVEGRIGERPLTHEEILGYCFLLFIAGLDTTAATLGYMFAYLAQHPERQQALRENPAGIPIAVEELLRRYAVVIANRRCLRDLEFRGVKMKAGDMVMIATPLACLDPQAYACPMDVNLQRQPNPHMAFSYGPHRCLGSHLARAELQAALKAWLARIPRFRLKPGTTLRHHTGVLGLDSLWLEWDRRARN